ncbi:MAG TPA: tRNA-uridine aminocarboxypropyltransferase [Polyangia bacterium]|jgi:DTW domain-containing protein YfiP|nr:tRNA-uridine aminocarboxypropyltransferase [Polyangia bacterium]
MSRRAKPHLRCEACRMHRSLCICALLPRIATRTRVLLVLHQLETQKPTNTGLVAARCLTNSAVVYRGRAPAGVEAEPLEAALAHDAAAALLFPHPSATPLESLPIGERPALLVVPDGTWPQAARARRRVGALARLPCVSLPETGATVDRLRAPPRPGRLATLEAVGVALGILEGPAVAQALLRVYRIMTERTLWTNGRLSAAEVTGGIPAGVRSHDPLGRA